MDLAVIHYYLASKILWYICYNLKLNQSGKITNMCSTKCPRAMNIQTIFLEYVTAFFGTCSPTTMCRVPKHHNISPLNLTCYSLCSSKTVLDMLPHWKLLAKCSSPLFFGVSTAQLRHLTPIV